MSVVGHASIFSAARTLWAMPIYEYRCETCDERFEELVRRPDDTVACPQCGGGSAAALPDYSRMSHHRNAGGCCGGACGHMH